MLEDLTLQLQSSISLKIEQVDFAVEQLVNEHLLPEPKAAFLTALAEKAETVEEIAGFVRALRARSIPAPLDANLRSQTILDVCGTGGDRLNTFNISTTVALLAAAAGVTVAKHGNRAVTSQAGSADVLEALGIRIDLSPEDAVKSLHEHQFAFFFAPAYHPAFKHIRSARQICAQRGQRTIFNFLGPLLNPALPTVQLVGVPRPELCVPIAQVLQALGTRRAMVVCGEVEVEAPTTAAGKGVLYLDELSTLGQSTVAEFYQDKGFAVSALRPDPGLLPARLADLKGADASANAGIVLAILRGEERGPKREAVLLNAGAALFVAGKTRTMNEGLALALEMIESGRGLKKLQALVKAFPR